MEFYDVRGTSSFEEEHIEGAQDVSLLDLRRGKIPPKPAVDMVVTYCGCPHSMAEEAAGILLANGYTRVAVLDDGFYGWKDNGFPVWISKKKAEWQRLEMRGQVILAGKPLPPEIEVVDPVTLQMEKAELASDGQFILHMPYYGNAETIGRLLWRAGSAELETAYRSDGVYRLEFR